MRTEKNMSAVLKHLNKEEVNLSAEKVELGLIDDYNSRIDKANNARKKAASSLSRLDGDVKEVVIHLELALKEAEKIKKAADELGLSSPVDAKKTSDKLKEFQKVASAIGGLKINV